LIYCSIPPNLMTAQGRKQRLDVLKKVGKRESWLGRREIQVVDKVAKFAKHKANRSEGDDKTGVLLEYPTWSPRGRGREGGTKRGGGEGVGTRGTYNTKQKEWHREKQHQK